MVRFSASVAVATMLSLTSAMKYTVKVGAGGKLLFDPQTVMAKVNDEVEFQFFARNHSVTQSSFDNPCNPIDRAIFSAFVPSASPDTASATTFTVKVTDTIPKWFYCGQTNGDHCQSGMLFAINP
jgi:plastocyanin